MKKNALALENVKICTSCWINHKKLHFLRTAFNLTWFSPNIYRTFRFYSQFWLNEYKYMQCTFFLNLLNYIVYTCTKKMVLKLF